MNDIQKVSDIALNAILEQKTVQQLFDEVYKETHLPIMCFDTCFNYIAHACDGKFNLSSWDDIVFNGKANEDFVEQFNYLEKQEKIYNAGKPLLMNTGASEKHPSVNCAVVINDSPVAYCGVMVEDADIDFVFKVNHILIKTIPLIMENEMVISNASVEGYDISELLTGNSIPEGAANIIASKYPYLYYFVIISYNGHSVPIMQYSQNYIKNLLGKCMSTSTSDNMVYMLFYDVRTDIYVNKLIETLSNVGKTYSFTCGFSCGFANPREIPLRRRQAMLASTIGQQAYPDMNAFSFREIYADILSHYAVRELPEEICILPEIRKLIEAEKDSELYLSTLYQYLINFRRPSLAAKKLGIHKNTVIYRISKMEEIMHTDLHDGRNCDRFYLSLTAYAAMKQLDFRKAGDES